MAWRQLLRRPAPLLALAPSRRLPIHHTHLDNHVPYLLLLSRSLRTARGARSSARIAAALAFAEDTARSSRHKNQLERAAAAPVTATRRAEAVVAVPAFIRVRDLAKLLHRPVDEVLKLVASRAHRKLHMTLDAGEASRTQLEFKNVKQVVLPFQKAREVAAALGMRVAYDEVEPSPTVFRSSRADLGSDVTLRRPVIAVMGHVDHGKTTLMDALRLDAPFAPARGSSRPLAPYEAQGITQKINVCDAPLSVTRTATFLDTPGHFHFFRMRSSAAQVADVAVLVVAADEGVRLQTEESIGAIEEAGIPAVVCVNKLDLLDEQGDEEDRDRVQDIEDELRGFVALQSSAVIGISGKTGRNLDELRAALARATDELAEQGKLGAYVGPDTLAEGLVLESVAMKGRGMVLRVLLKHGVLKPREHFVAGMIHGAVRSLRDAGGQELAHALPGMVVDVTYANKSKYVDAPNEFGFYVLPEVRATQVVEQRQLAMDFEDCVVYRSPVAADSIEDAQVTPTRVDELQQEEEEEIDENDLVETASIIVKADQAGSLTSIQDTVDEMPGISTVRMGIGHISAKDIDVAINGKCPIFGFNVKLRRREARMAASRGVRVVLRSTVHELIEDISAHEQQHQQELEQKQEQKQTELTV